MKVGEGCRSPPLDSGLDIKQCLDQDVAEMKQSDFCALVLRDTVVSTFTLLEP